MEFSLIPRPEYPRPQFVRKDWLNLNGEWEFEIDSGLSGVERKLFLTEKLSGKIIVPFCPESRLSGVGNKDFMPAVWYRRTFTVPPAWRSNRVILHFGAVDYFTQVWVNGQPAGAHKGGYTPFSFDITDLLVDGVNTVAVCAQDDVRSGRQPRGKQSGEYYSHGCDYTRTTGIWQTVWLESVPGKYIERAKFIPDPDNSCLRIECACSPDAQGCVLEAEAYFDGSAEGMGQAVVTGNHVSLTVHLNHVYLWGPGKPNLYSLELKLSNTTDRIDTVHSYFGMRTITLENGAICINHQPVFQRLILDQGFYPDGIYTAPSDADLKRDIEYSLALGFNGARMHQKVFDPRYLYWADKTGYLVWGEYPNWGFNITTPAGLEIFLPEWMESVERDYSSPALVGWCPFNETWDCDGTKQDNDVLRMVYNVTKALDTTRPVIDTSGNFHVVTDIFDVHDYEQNPAVFASHYDPMAHGGEAYNTFPERQHYEGQPYFVSEYGGIWWNPGNNDGKAWGYGNRPASKEDFISRYDGLTSALLGNPKICAFCYTQLTDVEQEVNGLYTYDRQAKFDSYAIYKINTQQAAIEKQTK